MRWTWLAVLLAVVAARDAAADDEDDGDAAWDVSDPTTIATRLHGRLDGTTAHLDVHLAFDVTEIPNASTLIGLPPHAVVTGARVTVDGAEHRLALLPAADAHEALYKMLDGADGRNHRSGLVLRMEDHTLYAETIVPKATHFELELALEATTCYYRDARYVAIPADWKGALDRELARMPIAPASELEAACHGDKDGEWIAFPSRELAKLPAGERRIAVAGERLPLPHEHLASVELSIASRLGEVPRDLHTAIVVDASRSVSKEEAEVQLAMVESYLDAAPHGDVQVIAYARAARALLPAWTVAAHADTQVERALRGLSRRNGSNLDAGLVEAATWLARVGGTRRVILFTDERVASRLDSGDTSELAKLLPPGTLVHVVALTADAGATTRDDTATFAPLAAATLGMSVRGRVDEHGEADAMMLARPISLDHVSVKADGWSELSLDDVTACAGTDAMPEGTSCTWWGDGTATSGAVTLDGWVWGTHVVREVAPATSAARSLARTLSTMSGLDSQTMEEVERAAVAVNSVWSLFVRWGGQDGYGGWTSGCGCGSGSSNCGFGIGHFGTRGSFSSRPRLDLHDQFVDAMEVCHAERLRVRFDIETTLEEIVDVDVSVGGTGTEAVHDCLVEAAWNTMLAIPDAPAYATTTVEFN